MADEATSAAFRSEVLQVLGLARGFARRLARHPADADDLLQESLFRALRNFHQFEPGANFKAWLMRIMTNTWFSSRAYERRRAGPSLDVEDAQEPEARAEVAASTPLPGNDWRTVYAEVVDDDVKQALDDLPEVFRVPLLLSCLGDLSHAEIAATLGVAQGTVMSRLFRARARLRQALASTTSARATAKDAT